ncbi:hypothetical protein P0136_02560 [Lentisphaerota bacterium ZTH]|nr:hypothetical protein JYG24_06300 [Lentisphaerota bacterium]WET06883.1 hypothetical protein P0136_02560 [Lentisphaerota bacterium ZTH]
MMSDNAIKKFMAEQLNAGIGLAEIQKLIDEKFERKMTFLEVRLLASELENIQWETEEEEPEVTEDDIVPVEEEPPAGDGSCVVEISKLVKPGAVAHGSVQFPSGASADWMLDNMGRLGLENSKGDPTPEDFEAFKEELHKAFAGGGM